MTTAVTGNPRGKRKLSVASEGSIIVGVFTFLVAAAIFLFSTGEFAPGGYDRFNPFELKVSSLKTDYTIGDEIEFKFDIIPPGPDKIRLFERKERSLFLSVSPKKDLWWAVGGYDEVAKISGVNFKWAVSADNTISPNEKIEEINIYPAMPYSLTVRGLITKDQTSGNIIFDFFSFGRFEILKKSDKYYISGFWRPINPHPFDSLEDMTNELEVSVKDAR
ncbi:MAG: hypothetical protein HQL30_12450 [Candidatus Omnitrophica bacterium]|nr:hypothetical protein [Candidatus Omnitrophota bacterium]